MSLLVTVLALWRGKCGLSEEQGVGKDRRQVLERCRSIVPRFKLIIGKFSVDNILYFPEPKTKLTVILRVSPNYPLTRRSSFSHNEYRNCIFCGPVNKWEQTRTRDTHHLISQVILVSMFKAFHGACLVAAAVLHWTEDSVYQNQGTRNNRCDNHHDESQIIMRWIFVSEDLGSGEISCWASVTALSHLWGIDNLPREYPIYKPEEASDRLV